MAADDLHDAVFTSSLAPAAVAVAAATANASAVDLAAAAAAEEIKNVSNENPEIVERIESIMLNARTTPILENFKIKALDN